MAERETGFRVSRETPSATQTSIVQVTILLGAEVTIRVHGFATLWAERAPTGGNFHTPTAHGEQLRPGAPKAYYASFFSILSLWHYFPGDQNQLVTLGIIAQTKLAHPEKRVYRWVNVHLILGIITGGSW
jgi:hypothetical protein